MTGPLLHLSLLAVLLTVAAIVALEAWHTFAANLGAAL